MFNLNIHDVTSIEIEPARENESSGSIYATRTIVIRTSDGREFELSLFSPHVSCDNDDTELLQVRS